MVAAGAEYVEFEQKGFAATDVLVVVDMQNDFVPAEDAPEGGKFGVPEGGQVGHLLLYI